MARIVVVTHQFDIFASQPEPTQRLSSSYLLFDVLEALKPMGYSWRIAAGTEPPRGDIAILHVNATRVPGEYLALAQRFKVAINFNASDISKRRIGTALLGRGDDWAGPVIVKTDLNYGGKPETAINERAAARGLPPPFPGAAAWEHYPIFETIAEVPEEFWDDGSKVVQRFLPELDEHGYAMRTWVFAGDRERCTRHVSEDRVIKAARIISRSPTEVPDALRAERARLGFDFGKFDFVMHQGEPLLLDANRTPGTATGMREFIRDGANNLARGLHALIESAPGWRMPAAGNPFAAHARITR